MIRDREPMRLLLNRSDERENGRGRGNGYFMSLWGHQCACSMAVVLHHTEGRNRETKLV